MLCILCTFLKGSEDSSASLTSSPMQKSDVVWPCLILKQFVYGIYIVCYCNRVLYSSEVYSRYIQPTLNMPPRSYIYI